jgi:hypothetical protein
MHTEPENASGGVRCFVYDYVIREGLPPSIAVAAEALSRTADETKAAFQRLADEHVLVLQKGSDEILMAAPFSAVPTPFLVKVGEREYYANCIWDALGIPAMLKRDADITSSCGCCGRAMKLRIANNALAEARGLAHFALPAARWWDNVVFT